VVLALARFDHWSHAWATSSMASCSCGSALSTCLPEAFDGATEMVFRVHDHTRSCGINARRLQKGSELTTAGNHFLATTLDCRG
jgi:hypothetical protein